MKKMIVFVSLFLICFLMCSCETKQNTENHSVRDTQINQSDNQIDIAPSHAPDDPPAPETPKLSKEFEAITPFSQGKAFVKIRGDENKNLYIDNKGAVLFEISEDLISSDSNYMPVAKTYKSGLVLISDAYGMEWTIACSKEGILFKAEDYGLKEFSDLAADDGYLIAYGTGKVGILNADFEWIVEPSASFAKHFPYGIDGTTYYKDHMIYSKVGNARVDVTTGAVEDYRLLDASVFFDDVPDNWRVESDGYYFYMNISEVKKELRLGIENIQTAMTCKIDCEGACFVNDKAPVVLYDNGSQYFSIINATGELLLEPVLYDGMIGYISISDQYIYVGCEGKTSLSIYDIAGNLITSRSKIDFEQYSTDYVICDDVITFQHFIWGEDGKIVRKYYCYTPDFSPLIGA